MRFPEQLSFLRKQRFLPLFIVQFLAAFNDNVFKNALIILITFKITTLSLSLQQIAITLAGGLFILPFFLFSAIAGELADKYDKRHLIILLKVLEVVFTMIGAVGFFYHWVGLLMLSLFLMGTHSTFFGPIKYAILPDKLAHKELLAGNAWIEASTFMGILLGTLLGGILIPLTHGETWTSSAMIIISLLGLTSSLYITPTPSPMPQLTLNANFLKSTITILRQIRKEKNVYLSILGISWFWLIGASLLTQLPAFTRYTLHANAFVVTFFLMVFSIGIAIGSLLCGPLFKGEITPKYVPASLWLMTWFILDIYLAAQHLPSLASGSLVTFKTFFYYGADWRITLDMFLLAVFGGIYMVPLYTIMQTETATPHRSRTVAAANILNSLFMVVSAIVCIFLLKVGLKVSQLFLCLGIANAVVALYLTRLFPEGILKPLLRWLLKSLYAVEIRGFENYSASGKRTLIIANHTSFLDVVLLYAYLPDDLLFAINTFTAKTSWIKPILRLVKVIELNPLNPMSIKRLVQEIKKDKKCVIFPEGRITMTGGLMKIYEGPGLVADYGKASLLPIRIEGAQYSPFSRLKGKVKIRWFPAITMTILPPRCFEVSADIRGRERRQMIGTELYKLMVGMLFDSEHYKKILFQRLLEAKMVFRGRKKVLEDVKRVPVDYNRLITYAYILARRVKKQCGRRENVGIILPNSIALVQTFFAIQAAGSVTAMLNYAAGTYNLLSACEVAEIRTIYTSKKFIQSAFLENEIAALKKKNITIIYLENEKNELTALDKIWGWWMNHLGEFYYLKKLTTQVKPEDPAVILFTSGSEGKPKGAMLSHANIQANCAQLSTVIDFNQHDIFFTALPAFHAFGLTPGILFPLFYGLKTFLYPSPLHYRKISNMIYDCNATITFGTDTFLSAYGRYAHPYDFYSLRYVFAGAEKLKETTRKLWMDKFGIRLFEGYGATEASPVISVNTPLQNKIGTVGCLLPGIQYVIKPTPDIEAPAGELLILGPNVLLGYLKAENPGEIFPPLDSWYHTGDIVEIDNAGYMTIKDRRKRFAKIGGEMVSLTAVENFIYELWPHQHHAVLAQPDARKGEQLLLITDKKEAAREEILKFYKAHGINELMLPRKIIFEEKIPLLGSGKPDYRAIMMSLEKE